MKKRIVGFENCWRIARIWLEATLVGPKIVVKMCSFYFWIALSLNYG